MHAVQLMSVFLWFMTSYSSVDNCQSFEVVFCLHLRGSEWWQREISCLLQKSNPSHRTANKFSVAVYMYCTYSSTARRRWTITSKFFVFVLLSNPTPKTCACIFLQKFSYTALYSVDLPTPPPIKNHTSRQLFFFCTLGQITEICDSNSSWEIFCCLKAITPKVTGFFFCTFLCIAGHIALFAQILLVASNATWGTHVTDSVEQMPCPAASQKFPAFYGTWRFITAFTGTCQPSPFQTRSIQATPSHPISWRSVLTLHYYLQLGLPNVLFPSCFPTKRCINLSFPPIRATCHAHLIRRIWTPG